MNKFKSSESSIVVPLVFVIHLVHDAQFLNNTCVAGTAMTVIGHFPKMEVSL